jgi:hypothetical protein
VPGCLSIRLAILGVTVMAGCIIDTAGLTGGARDGAVTRDGSVTRDAAQPDRPMDGAWPAEAGPLDGARPDAARGDGARPDAARGDGATAPDARLVDARPGDSSRADGPPDATAPPDGPTPISNLAPTGTAYLDCALTSRTANNRTANPGLNDGDTSTLVNCAAESANDRWQGASVLWARAFTITSVAFHQGRVTADFDGFFDAAGSLRLQYSTDGGSAPTWTDAAWTLSPDYLYDHTVADRVYTFQGPELARVKGVRVIGQLSRNWSWYWALYELQAFGR